MLYYLLSPLREHVGFFNVFRYITFRVAAAVVTALILSWLLGPWFIRQLRRLSVGQNIRDVGPQAHQVKAGTPTMGGLLILFATLVPTLLWMDLGNIYVWIVMIVTTAFGAIGFADDYLKVRNRRNLGLTAGTKFWLQILVGMALGIALLVLPAEAGFNPTLTFPFIKRLILHLGYLYIPFVAFVLAGSSNAVNLTDGLDGLAAGCAAITLLAYIGITFITQGQRDLTMLAACLVGACVGFLWFNSFPASIFMGDTGSLALGGAIAGLAVMTKTEVLLVLLGGIFVLEALSVLIQVFSFQTFRKRVFLMAPIHHHFELRAWSETKIILRFWIVAAACSAVGFVVYQLSVRG